MAKNRKSLDRRIEAKPDVDDIHRYRGLNDSQAKDFHTHKDRCVMTMSSGRSLAFAIALVLVGVVGFWSIDASKAAEPIYADDGIAIDGTDPVSYFSEGKPVAGSAEFSHRWKGVDWHFSSAENRDRFAADPDAFAPRYGGYCAWAVANGYTASTVPEAWHIEDGKLYLNYSLGVRGKWRQDIPGNIEKADGNWPQVLDKG